MIIDGCGVSNPPRGGGRWDGVRHGWAQGVGRYATARRSLAQRPWMLPSGGL